MANNPDYQERISNEVNDTKEASTSLTDFISGCVLTTRVINESLRLYPPAYFIDRMSNENDEFQDIFIPARSSVLFSVYEIHRNPELWDDPEIFFPERFEKKELFNQFFPFGAGPRKCIGSNFAMSEMILTIAELVKRYKIEPRNPEIKTTPLITLKPRDMFLRLIKRE